MQRITKERKSSIVGAGIIIGAFVMLWFGKIDTSGLIAILTVGTGLLFSKDTWFGAKGPTGPAIIILFLLFTGCKSEQKWIDKGKKQGWVKQGKDSSSVSIPFDTTKNKEISDNSADKIEEILLKLNNGYKPTEESKRAISKTIKEQVIPQAVQAAIRDTLIEKEDGTIIKITKSGNGFNAEVVYQKTTIIDNSLPWWVWPVIGYQFILNGVLFFLLIRRRQCTK